ncbi:MAG: hypothetical protein KAI47_21580, partial [Deltaproteobacteria bacterium]|nr:hypothetical protein [Deltaproteobacteria bacterium]
MTTHLAALEEAFRRDPASTETFAALDRNYRANGQEDALPKLYERHADAIGDMRQAAELCWQAAKLYDKRHKNEDELRVLRRAVSLDASVHEATDRLTQLAEEGERWSELVHLFDKAIGNLETANNPLRLAQFQFHAGRIWETRFHRLDKAIAYYQAAFKSDPTHTDAIEAGRRIYAAAGRWPIVLQLYEIEIATTHETKSRADLLLEMAEVAREKTGELETAARALTEAAQLRPGEETIIEALGEVYASPEWPAPGGLERAAQIFIQIAQRREARSDRDGTISYLRRALGADPENEGAATRLERAYRETGRWEDLDRLFRQ